jgi:hypothetical protein
MTSDKDTVYSYIVQHSAALLIDLVKDISLDSKRACTALASLIADGTVEPFNDPGVIQDFGNRLNIPLYKTCYALPQRSICALFRPSLRRLYSIKPRIRYSKDIERLRSFASSPAL